MISPKPSIVIVPGAWHSASHFASTTSLLESAGYTVHAVTLPSVGASPALQDWHLDIATIRSTIETAVSKQSFSTPFKRPSNMCKIISQIGPDGNRVVIVMHSYGGLPTQDAVYDLDLPTRLAAGQSGGVIRLVYLAAFIGDQGESLADIRADQKSGWIAIDEVNDTRNFHLSPIGMEKPEIDNQTIAYHPSIPAPRPPPSPTKSSTTTCPLPLPKPPHPPSARTPSPPSTAASPAPRRGSASRRRISFARMTTPRPPPSRTR
ncbi:hypothetical protein MPH_06791 [Macrophomina phaseolina MS6]|uniref:AB hydrolase-1 domain-containing protein n=1 Tax=Macrophomina phaseolina (strain MS6) TaxID=1126212 RepID=K2SGK7_MACPH|nr:hypothetical protein MPH_06791 [Macrophomina phaseolina MS6]